MSDAEWPQFVFLDASWGGPYGMYAVEAGTFVSNDDFESPIWDEACESEPTTYLHRDAARAWAGLVMWCKLDWPPTPVSKTVEGVRFMIKVYDGCRAWQALRDFLDGTAEQWQQAVDDAYDEGREDAKRGLWDDDD